MVNFDAKVTKITHGKKTVCWHVEVFKTKNIVNDNGTKLKTSELEKIVHSSAVSNDTDLMTVLKYLLVSEIDEVDDIDKVAFNFRKIELSKIID